MKLAKLTKGNKRPHKVIRINRSKNAIAAGKITQQGNRSSKISKIASKDGVILSAVVPGVADHQVALARTGYKTMHDSLGSMATGTSYVNGKTAQMYLLGNK